MRLAARLLRAMILVLFGAFGAPPPRFVRHEDPIAAVADAADSPRDA